MANVNYTERNNALANGARMVTTRETAVRNADWAINRLAVYIESNIKSMTSTEIVSYKFRYERAQHRLEIAIAAR